MNRTSRDILIEEFEKFWAGHCDPGVRDLAFHWFKKGDRIGVQTGKRLEQEKTIETLKRIRELVEYQHDGWNWFIGGCEKTVKNRNVPTFEDLGITMVAMQHQNRAKDILELIDYLLKDLDK